MFNLGDFLLERLGLNNPKANAQPARRQAMQPMQKQPLKPMAQLQGQPASEVKYPRFNPNTGFRDPGPAPQRTDGLPQNFLGAPQLPVHDPELYDEVLRMGGFNTPRQSMYKSVDLQNRPRF